MEAKDKTKTNPNQNGRLSKFGAWLKKLWASRTIKIAVFAVYALSLIFSALQVQNILTPQTAQATTSDTAQTLADKSGYKDKIVNVQDWMGSLTEVNGKKLGAGYWWSALLSSGVDTLRDRSFRQRLSDFVSGGFVDPNDCMAINLGATKGCFVSQAFWSDTTTQKDPVAYKILIKDGFTLLEEASLGHVDLHGDNLDTWTGVQFAISLYKALEKASLDPTFASSAPPDKISTASAQVRAISDAAPALEKLSATGASGILAAIGGIIGWIIKGTLGPPLHALFQIFISFLQGTIKTVTGWVVGSGLLEIQKPGELYGTAWGFVKDLANSFFVIILVLIAVANIVRFQIEQYSIKVALPRLILAILLANLSLFIADFLVDAANSMQGLFVPDAWHDQLQKLQVPAGLVSLVSTNSVSNTVTDLPAIALTTIVFVLFLIAMLWLIIVQFARLALVYLLAVIAPIAFACYALPAAAKYFQQWWRYFAGFIVIGPFVAFALYMTGLILSAVPTKTHLNPGFLNKSSGLGDTDLVKIIMAALLVFMAGYLPVLLGGKFFGFGAKMMGTAAKALGKWYGSRGIQHATRIPTRLAGHALMAMGMTDLGGQLVKMRGFNPLRTGKFVQEQLKMKEESAQSGLSKDWGASATWATTQPGWLKTVLGEEYGTAQEDRINKRAQSMSFGYAVSKLGRYKNDKLVDQNNKPLKGKDLDDALAAPAAIKKHSEESPNEEVRQAAGLITAGLEKKDSAALRTGLDQAKKWGYAAISDENGGPEDGILSYLTWKGAPKEVAVASGVDPAESGHPAVHAAQQALTNADPMINQVAQTTGRPVSEIKQNVLNGTFPKQLEVSLQGNPQLSADFQNVINQSVQNQLKSNLDFVFDDKIEQSLDIASGLKKKPATTLVNMNNHLTQIIKEVKDAGTSQGVANVVRNRRSDLGMLGFNKTEIDMFNRPEKVRDMLQDKRRGVMIAQQWKSIEEKDPAAVANVRSVANAKWVAKGSPWQSSDDEKADFTSSIDDYLREQAKQISLQDYKLI